MLRLFLGYNSQTDLHSHLWTRSQRSQEAWPCQLVVAETCPSAVSLSRICDPKPLNISRHVVDEGSEF